MDQAVIFLSLLSLSGRNHTKRLVFLLLHPDLNFAQWHELFTNHLFQIATVIGLLALSLHAWVGIWTVTTDYIKCTAIRLSVQLVVVLLLLSQFIWGLMIVWG